MSNKAEIKDVYQKVTDQIIAAIERGADDFEMPWNQASGMPKNAATGKHYRGVNVVTLWAESARNGYKTSTWATYAQWTELGAQVRKGEKSAFIVFWKFFGKETEDNSGAEGTESTLSGGAMARGYHVFNADQVDGYVLPEPVLAPVLERNAAADRFFGEQKADVRFLGGRAFYNRAGDFIQVPLFDQFKDEPSYYSTLGHEFVHWTSKENRANRNMGKRFGDMAYAAEELIAELGAAFLCADLGLSSEPRADHASYLQNWLQVLRNDKRAIFTAASKAQVAVDWMHENVAPKAIAA